MRFCSHKKNKEAVSLQETEKMFLKPKFPRIVMLCITLLFLVVIAASYFLYYKEPNLNCAKMLITMQLLNLPVQLVLNYFNYKSRWKIVVYATLFIGSVSFTGVLYSFFNFRLLCAMFAY